MASTLEQLVGLYGFMFLFYLEWRLPHPMDKGSRGAIRVWKMDYPGPPRGEGHGKNKSLTYLERYYLG